MRILNGDGGGWIKGGLIDDTVHFQLDPFHLNRDIIRKVRDKNQRRKIMSLLKEKKVESTLAYLKELLESTTDEKEAGRLTELHTYFFKNKDELSLINKETLIYQCPLRELSIEILEP